MIRDYEYRDVEKTIMKQHDFIKVLFYHFDEDLNKKFTKIKRDLDNRVCWLDTDKTIFKQDLIKLRREMSKLIKLIDEKM